MSNTHAQDEQIVHATLDALTPDGRNPNRHSKRGREVLQKSVRKFASREAGTLDRHGNIVGGNNRAQVYAELGLDEITIVKADASRPVFIQYDDLDLTDPQNPARELSVALNRAAQLSIDFDPEVLAQLVDEGVELGEYFDADELGAIQAAVGDAPSLDDLEKEFGAHDEQTMWPKITLSVPPDVFERYNSLMTDAQGKQEWERFERLLQAVSVPALTVGLGE